MFWTNYHSHSHFCDGSEAPESYVRAALAQGVRALGFSAHAPLADHQPWAMHRDQLADYMAETSRLATRFSGEIELYQGLEIDYVPGISWWDNLGTPLRQMDYLIGAVHGVDQFSDGSAWEIRGDRLEFVRGLEEIFNGDVRAAVTRYYELVRWMIMLENPDIVAHLDLIKVHNAASSFFSETETWYRKEIEKTLKVIANMGTVVEVSTRGLYTGECLDLYPSQWILEQMLALGIPMTLSSDAHKPEEVAAGFGFAAQILNKIGYTHMSVLLDDRWTDVRFNEDGLEIPGQEQHSRTA